MVALNHLVALASMLVLGSAFSSVSASAINARENGLVSRDDAGCCSQVCSHGPVNGPAGSGFCVCRSSCVSVEADCDDLCRDLAKY